MIVFNPQFVVDKNAKPKAVIIPYNEWEKIMEEIEELDDIRAYDAAKSKKDDEIISFETAVNEIQHGIVT